jgi:hypothetical protein
MQARQVARRLDFGPAFIKPGDRCRANKRATAYQRASNELAKLRKERLKA